MIAVLAITRFVHEIIPNSFTRQGDVGLVVSFRIIPTNLSCHGDENLDEHKIDYCTIPTSIGLVDIPDGTCASLGLPVYMYRTD